MAGEPNNRPRSVRAIGLVAALVGACAVAVGMLLIGSGLDYDIEVRGEEVSERVAAIDGEADRCLWIVTIPLVNDTPDDLEVIGVSAVIARSSQLGTLDDGARVPANSSGDVDVSFRIDCPPGRNIDAVDHGSIELTYEAGDGTTRSTAAKF